MTIGIGCSFFSSTVDGRTESLLKIWVKIQTSILAFMDVQLLPVPSLPAEWACEIPSVRNSCVDMNTIITRTWVDPFMFRQAEANKDFFFSSFIWSVLALCRRVSSDYHCALITFSNNTQHVCHGYIACFCSFFSCLLIVTLKHTQ